MPDKNKVDAHGLPVEIQKDKLIDRDPNWLDVIPYFLPSVMMLMIPFTFYVFNNVMLIIWLGYVGFPILDYITPHDDKNLTPQAEVKFEKDKRFLIPMYVMFFVDLGVYFWCLHIITTDQVDSIRGLIVLTFAAAHSNGVNGIMGHELIHRRENVHKIFGTLCFAKFFYGHFFMEHRLGHHINVATFEDPATSRYNEPFFKFVWRSSSSGFVDSLHREAERLKRRGKSQYSLENRVILFTLLTIAFLALMYHYYGWKAIIFHIFYGGYAIILGEGVNYVEHYGLQRKKDEKGTTDGIDFTHSWNAPHRFSNYVLFRIQRHSDHHAHSYRPYQILRSFDISPQLPYGYETSIILAMVPSIWRQVMNPYVDALRAEKTISPDVKKNIDRITVYFLCGVS